MANVHDKVSNVQEQMATAMGRVGEAAHNVGQKVSDFFQGNPFETAVGRKIELATDATKLATENWGLNMEICDFVNCTNEGPRDAVRAIRKRLQTQMGKNNAIVMYTLTVLETCVKNCDIRFTTLICQKEFVAELVKLISAKHDAPLIVQERVLGLIQSWADAFRDNPALTGVVEMYDELKSKGVEFPPTNLDSMAPIITPKQTVFPEESDKPAVSGGQHDFTTMPQTIPSAAALSQQQPKMIIQHPTGPIQLSPEQMAKLRSELDIVQVNMEVFRELVAQMKPAGGENQQESPEPPEDFHFLQELYTTCKEMQKRILDLIPVVTNEEVTYELLSINDELNSSFEKYDRCMANFNAHGIDVSMIPSGSGTAAKTTTITTTLAGDQPKQQSSDSDNLIDLGPNEGKPLSEQFQAIDLNSNAAGSGGAPKGSGSSNDAFVHDQTDLGIHTVAYNKPEPPIASAPTTEVQPAKKPAIDDDGL